jgi:hypothetical protein
MSAAPLALIEVLARDGSVRERHRVMHWPQRIGRAIDADLVLDDVHVAAEHLLLQPDAAGQLQAQALPSHNGLRLNRRRIAAGNTVALLSGQALEVGGTRLRVRMAGESLAPERPLASEGWPRGALLTAGLFWLWMLLDHWLDTDPGGKAIDWVAPILGVPLALAAWCLLWALASKLFQGRFDFWGHFRIAAPLLLVMELLSWLLPGLAGMFNLNALSRIDNGVTALLFTVQLVLHVRQVLPQHGRAFAATGAVGFVVAATVMMVQNDQRHDRWFSELYTASLPPPALRFAPLQTPQAFVEAAAALRPRLDERAAKAAAENEGDEEGLPGQ